MPQGLRLIKDEYLQAVPIERNRLQAEVLSGMGEEVVDHFALGSYIFSAYGRVDHFRFVRHRSKCAGKDCNCRQPAGNAGKPRRCRTAPRWRLGAGRPAVEVLAPAAAPEPKRSEIRTLRGHVDFSPACRQDRPERRSCLLRAESAGPWSFPTSPPAPAIARPIESACR